MYRHSVGQKRLRNEDSLFVELQETKRKMNMYRDKVEQQATRIKELMNEVEKLKAEIRDMDDLESRLDPFMQRYATSTSSEAKENVKLRSELKEANDLIVKLQSENELHKDKEEEQEILHQLAELSDPAPTPTNDNQIGNSGIIKDDTSTGNKENIRKYLSDYAMDYTWRQKGKGKGVFVAVLTEVFALLNDYLKDTDKKHYESKIRFYNKDLGKGKNSLHEFMLHNVSKNVELPADSYKNVLRNFLPKNYTAVFEY